MSLSSTPEIVAEIAAGRMVILVDEEDRENEGDLVLAADFVTPEAINFMARFGRGLICLTLTEEHCRQLRLSRMVENNNARHGTNFTVSIEAAEGVSTGISAADRARTVQAAVARDAKPDDIVQPGHIFPLMAQSGGVLVRAGHTEAGCDLARLAGRMPAAVICEILRDDGSMARLPDLIEFAAVHGLKIGTIADLIQYRSAHESLIERICERTIESRWGPLKLVAYRDQVGGSPHLALVHGEIESGHDVLVRVHEPLSPIDLLESVSTLHSWSLDRALSRIVEERAGVAVLLNCAQPAAALFDELRALDEGAADARARRRSNKLDLRTYGIGAQILKDLGVGRMRLLSPPRKMPSMTGYELEVVGFESMEEGKER